MLHLWLLLTLAASAKDDVDELDPDYMAQSFLETCIEKGGDTKNCKMEALRLFGSTGKQRQKKTIGGSSETEGQSKINFGDNGGPPPVLVDRERCTKSNTIYIDGYCQCKLGFTHGDPLNLGCWECDTRCHQLASCTQFYGCMCNEYYIGDGIESCEMHIPSLRGAYTKKDKRTVVAVIDQVNWSYPHKAYCKFGKATIEGQLVDSEQIECIRSSTVKENTQVQVSWDGFTFSKQKVDVTVYEVVKLQYVYITVGAAVVVSYAGYLIWKFRKHQRAMQLYEEEVARTGRL